MLIVVHVFALLMHNRETTESCARQRLDHKIGTSMVQLTNACHFWGSRGVPLDRQKRMEWQMAGKPRVFISFDYDHDEVLKTFLVGQSKNPDTPFELSDWSIKEPMAGNWVERARSRVRSVDVMAVICGLHTHTATGVSEEVRLAQQERIPYFLLYGYADKSCTKPVAARPTDKMYKWTWDNLKALIAGAR